jgi:hypothetical protein
MYASMHGRSVSPSSRFGGVGKFTTTAAAMSLSVFTPAPKKATDSLASFGAGKAHYIKDLVLLPRLERGTY